MNNNNNDNNDTCDLCDALANVPFEQGGMWHTLCGYCEAETRPNIVQVVS